MANVAFYRGTSVPTNSTLSDGGIYFNTSKKKIYLNSGGTVYTFDGNNTTYTIPTIPVVTAALTCGFFDLTGNTQSPMYGIQSKDDAANTAGSLSYDRWPESNYVNFSSSSYGYTSFVKELWNAACTAYNDQKILLVHNATDELISVCSVSVVEVRGYDSTTYALRVSGMKDGIGNVMAVEMSRGLTTKTFQTTADATIMVACYRSFNYAI